MTNKPIQVHCNTQSDLLAFIKENLIGKENLSIRGLARLCNIQHTSIIRDGAFNARKLSQTLAEQGFEAGALLEKGFNAKATWLVIEYFAYESKAQAEGAKQLARTFGQLGVIQTFENLTKPPIPKTFAEALRLAADQQEEIERLQLEKELIEGENQVLSEQLDELFDYSSIIRIAKYNKVSEKNFSWRILKHQSLAMGKEIKKVPCPRYGEKNLYAHEVWRYCYPDMKVPETTTLVIKK